MQDDMPSSGGKAPSPRNEIGYSKPQVVVQQPVVRKNSGVFSSGKQLKRTPPRRDLNSDYGQEESKYSEMAMESQLQTGGELKRAHTSIEKELPQSHFKRFASQVNDEANILGSGLKQNAVRQRQPLTEQRVKKNQFNPEKKQRKKNENILCAIITLMKELDKSGLEFIKIDATKRIHKMEMKERQAYSSEEEEEEQ